MSTYIDRVLDKELDQLLSDLPAISVEGPKGVGKTETCRRRANTVHELDDPAQREIIEADPSRIRDGDPPILVDEWQRVPESWDIIRRAVDDNTEPKRFLLTGSATPSDRPTHSGAGRIVTLRLRPLSLMERGLTKPTVSLSELLSEEKPTITGTSETTLEEYVQEIVHSGLPGIRNLDGRALREQLDSYVNRIVDTDFEQLGRELRKPETLKRWMQAYAAATATTASYEKIRDAATSDRGDKPSNKTTRPYREILERLWIMEQVPAWVPSRNQFSRLSRPPKHHLADPAFASTLLGVDKDALLKGEESGLKIPRDGTLLGALFESLVTQSVRVYAQPTEASVKHLRTQGGRQEIDLIVERRDQKVLALEVKLNRTVEDSDVKHLKWLEDKMGEDLVDAAVINTGPNAYRRDDGIAVIPADMLTV